MGKAIVEYQDFVCMDSADQKKIHIPEKFDSISFHYDGGRCSIYMNDKEVFTDNCVGNDFCVEIKVEGE